jgi:lipopolysaccharide/colanic/teichoic acid biosynthesis glycosyltransferase
MLKRAFDLVTAAAGLMLLAPLLFVLAFLVRVDSPGPVFFRQERVGQGGRLFEIHKFRTMVVQAPAQGPAITVGRDPRITRIGHWLRRYKLDELPQLFDVLKGAMSMVGPRPEVPRYVAAYPESLRSKVLSVKPGITDLASLEYVDESEQLARAESAEREYLERILPAKLKIYEYYVDNRSLWLDLRIICCTLAKIVTR